MNTNPLILMILLLATVSTLTAEEHTNSQESNESTKSVKINSAYRTSGLFLRVGILATGGTMTDKYKVKSYSYRNDYSGTDEWEMSSIGRELSLGGDFTHDAHRGIRFFATVKAGTDKIGKDFTASSKQLGLGLERYMGGKNVHLISGISTSYGATDDLDYDDTSLDYIALEPYIGLDFIKSNGFGGFAKFGYEWRFYSLIKDKVGAVSYEDSFEATNLTITTGLQYSF